MKNINRIIFLAAVLLLACGHIVSGQGSRERLIENRIVSAVEKYDERDFSRASELLEGIVAEAPDNDAAHFYLGLSEFCLGHTVAAERELKKAVSLDPDNFWYRYRLAMVYSATDRKELTTAMFEELLEDFPKKS